MIPGSAVVFSWRSGPFGEDFAAWWHGLGVALSQIGGSGNQRPGTRRPGASSEVPFPGELV
ncbi:hypothetical protein DSECCO2_505070 [anaerobic digester metagenome]